MSIQQYLQYVYSYIAEGIKQNMFHSFTTKSKSNQVKASAKWQDQKSMPLRDQNCLLRPDPVRSGVLQWFLLMGPSYSCWPFLPHHASSKNRIGCSTRDAVIYIYIHIYIYHCIPRSHQSNYQRIEVSIYWKCCAYMNKYSLMQTHSSCVVHTACHKLHGAQKLGRGAPTYYIVL